MRYDACQYAVRERCAHAKSVQARRACYTHASRVSRNCGKSRGVSNALMFHHTAIDHAQRSCVADADALDERRCRVHTRAARTTHPSDAVILHRDDIALPRARKISAAAVTEYQTLLFIDAGLSPGAVMRSVRRRDGAGAPYSEGRMPRMPQRCYANIPGEVIRHYYAEARHP
jgi:hypothetical protein